MSTSLLNQAPPAERLSPTVIRQTVLANLECIDNYPTLSEATIRAMAMVKDPNISTAEVAGIIYRDTILSAAVLRMANNWMFRGKKVVVDVQQAVLRIGLDECAKLLCTLGLRKMSSQQTPAVQARCESLLRHCLFVAHMSAAISRTVRRDYNGAEFTAGLLHDIGRLIACVKAPQDFAIVDSLDYEEDASVLVQERQQLGIDHCAIGYNFATKNNLPEGIVRVILNHHRPEEEQLQQELVALIAVADRLSNFAQREHKVKGYDLSKCPFYPFLVQYWPKEQKVALRRSLPVIVVQAIRETRQMLKAFK
jgi:putative nucleotidyltransferase with HDIG domain